VVSSKRTMLDWEGEGVSKKSVFARTSLIDDPGLKTINTLQMYYWYLLRIGF